MKFIFKTLVAIILIGALVYVYSKYIEPKMLIVKKYDFSYSQEDETKTSIKIAQFTDSQIGDFYNFEQLEKVVKKMNALKPDVIVFTGDLFDNGASENEITRVIELLSELDAPLGKFAVYGNRDVGGGMIRHYERIMTSSNFTLLINDTATITLNDGKKLRLYGLDDALLSTADIEEANSILAENEPTLVLLHEPDISLQFKNTKNALVLAGHTHGGQVNLPFIGPLATTSLGEVYVKGWYSLLDSSKDNLYVNSGLGNTKLTYRFGNIPHIALITVKL